VTALAPGEGGSRQDHDEECDQRTRRQGRLHSTTRGMGQLWSDEGTEARRELPPRKRLCIALYTAR
jgi:hypothetical protein